MKLSLIVIFAPWHLATAQTFDFNFTFDFDFTPAHVPGRTEAERQQLCEESAAIRSDFKKRKPNTPFAVMNTGQAGDDNARYCLDQDPNDASSLVLSDPPCDGKENWFFIKEGIDNVLRYKNTNRCLGFKEKIGYLFGGTRTGYTLESCSNTDKLRTDREIVLGFTSTETVLKTSDQRLGVTVPHCDCGKVRTGSKINNEEI